MHGTSAVVQKVKNPADRQRNKPMQKHNLLDRGSYEMRCR